MPAASWKDAVGSRPTPVHRQAANEHPVDVSTADTLDRAPEPALGLREAGVSLFYWEAWRAGLGRRRCSDRL